MSEGLRGRIRTGLQLGVVAGLVLGTLEAVERSRSIGPFVRNGVEVAGFGFALLGYLLLTHIAAGLTAGVVVGIGERMLGRNVRQPLARALLGALLGVALAAWTAYAFTLTVRFDRLVARWPVMLAAGAAAGVVAGLAWPLVTSLWKHASRGVMRSGAIVLVTLPLIALYLLDAHFAPQSSYGVHALLDTVIVALAFTLAGLLPRAGAGLVSVALTASIVLGVWCDHVMRDRPRIANLVKTRSALTGRAIDLWRGVLDGDRDGHAPRFLVGGADSDNRNPGVPQPIIDRSGTCDLPVVPIGYRPPSLPPTPNLLLLTIDACRYDVLPPDAHPGNSRMGDLLPPMRRIAGLVPRFARFEAAYTPSAGTEDTFGSLFSGAPLPGILAGVPESRYLARRLREAGYATRGFVNDPWFSSEPWAWPPLARFIPDDGLGAVNAAVAFLDSLPPGTPGLAWIHLMDLHANVLDPLSPDAYDHRAHLLRYAEGLVRVDSLVGALMRRLDASGLTDRTVMFLSADHGEELGGHGHYHHNLSLYEPAIRVPLWATGPGVVPGVRHAEVSLIDLYPTLLAAAGVTPGRCAGRSLWPMLTDVAPATSEPLLFSFLPQRGFSRHYELSNHPERGQAAVIDPSSGHKLILRLGDESWEAYDLSDRMERVSVAGDDVAWVGPLRARLDSLLRHNARPPSGP